MNRPISTVLAVLLVCAGCGQDTAPSDRGRSGSGVAVVTETILLQPMVDEIQALGTARANESVEIRPRIASLVTRIGFREGQYVESGDLLIELENSEIIAGLELARASLSESLSLYERSKSLASSQAISASNLEQLLAQVKVDEAQVEAARARLKNTRIYAPFSGRVGLRRVSPGSYVDSSTIITTLDDIDTIKLEFSIPEAFLPVLREGMTVDARSTVFPDQAFPGEIQSIDTRIDPVSRSVLARAIVSNPDRQLKPGMFMTVDLKRERGEKLIAPEQSIVPEGTTQYVFVVDDGTVRKQQVELGRRLPGRVVIEQGLEAGDVIVTEGTQKIRDGSAVEPVDSAPPDQAALLGLTVPAPC